MLLYAQKLKEQQGAFSPFMFGMLMGIAMFSAVVQYKAEKELEKIKDRRYKTEQQQTEDIKRALENAILTENVETGPLDYSKDVDMDRARGFLTGSRGQTRSGQEIITQSRKSGEVLGADRQRVVITASDDEFLREKIQGIGSVGAIENLEVGDNQSVAVFDSSEVRTRQIKQSQEYLRMEEAQIYRYWGSNNYKFPATQGDYEDSVNAYTGLRDAWGQKFTYNRINDNRAKLSFTTPWGYEGQVILKMDE